MKVISFLFIFLYTFLHSISIDDTLRYCKTFLEFNKIKKSLDKNKRAYYFTIGKFIVGETWGTPSKMSTTYIAQQGDTIGLIYTLTTKTVLNGSFRKK